MTGRMWITIAFAAVILGGFAAWIASQGRFVDETVEREPSFEARSNALLAYERLLTKLGFPAENRRSIASMPPLDRALVVHADGHTISRTMRERLIAWVERGGHLVVALPRTQGAAFRAASSPDDQDGPRGRERGTFATWFDFGVTRSGSTFGPRRLELASESYDVDFGQSAAITVSRGERPPSVAVVAPAPQFVSFPFGNGRVSVFGSAQPLENEHIAEHDHAAFGVAVLQLRPGTRGAWIVFDLDGRIGLFTRLWDAAWMVLAPLLALVGLWGWSVARRFGPRIADTSDDLRDFSDHLRASGEYLLRQREYTALVGSARAALMRTLAQRRPELAQRDARKREQELASVAGLSFDEVHDAIHSAPTSNHFVRMVKNLDRIRRSL